MTESEFRTYLAEPMAMQVTVALAMGLMMGGMWLAILWPARPFALLQVALLQEHRMPKLAFTGVVICMTIPTALFDHFATRAFETGGGATKYLFSWKIATTVLILAPIVGFGAGWVSTRCVEGVARLCRKGLRHLGHW